MTNKLESAAQSIKNKVTNINENATLETIQNLAILKEFNTAFIGYLREKANESKNNDFINLFDGNPGGKINDLKYSRLINGKKINNTNFPTNNQIKTLRNNQTIKTKVCENKNQNGGPNEAGTSTKKDDNAAAQSGPTTSSNNNNYNEGRLRTKIEQKINNINGYKNRLEQKNKNIFDQLKTKFETTKKGTNKIQPQHNAKARQILTNLNKLFRNTKPRPPAPSSPPPLPPQTAQTGGGKKTTKKKKSTSKSTKKKSTSSKKKSTSTKKKSTKK